MTNRASPDLILGLDGVVVDLMFRERKSNDPHTFSTWACELAKTFASFPSVTKLALAGVLAVLMWWLVAPTKENYLDLSPTSRKMEEQPFVSHPIGIDITTLTDIRRSLLGRGVQEWVCTLMPNALTFERPYSQDACLESAPVKIAGSDQAQRLSRTFVEHIHNADNFQLGPGHCESVF